MYKHLYTSLISSVCLLTMTINTNAQDLFAYPAAGQSVELQQKDKFECHQWAKGQTGFDPSRAQQSSNYAYNPPPSSNVSGGALDFGDAETGQGGVVRDGARGAALGAIGGAIAGDAGQGAAIGAVSGALFGGIRRSKRKAEEQRWQEQQAYQAQQQQQQMAQQQNQARAGFDRAYSACMTSRNYNVQ
jgi:Glycine-zipper domain